MIKKLIPSLLAFFRSGEDPAPLKPYSTEWEWKNEQKAANIERLRNFQNRFHHATSRWPAVYPCNVTLPKPEPQP